MTTDSIPVQATEARPATARKTRKSTPSSGRRRRLFRHPGAGRQHHAGPVAYILLGFAALL